MDTYEELVDALHEMQLSKIAVYVEGFYEEFYADSDWDDSDDFDYVLTEAFSRVYGCIRV